MADKINRTHERYLLAKSKEYPESAELKKRLTVLREICEAKLEAR